MKGYACTRTGCRFAVHYTGTHNVEAQHIMAAHLAYDHDNEPLSAGEVLAQAETMLKGGK